MPKVPQKGIRKNTGTDYIITATSPCERGIAYLCYRDYERNDNTDHQCRPRHRLRPTGGQRLHVALAAGGGAADLCPARRLAESDLQHDPGADVLPHHLHHRLDLVAETAPEWRRWRDGSSADHPHTSPRAGDLRPGDGVSLWADLGLGRDL